MIHASSFVWRSTGYGDELTWAAIWMYKATKENKYIEQAENFYNSYRLKERPNEFFYNKKVAGVQVSGWTLKCRSFDYWVIVGAPGGNDAEEGVFGRCEEFLWLHSKRTKTNAKRAGFYWKIWDIIARF